MNAAALSSLDVASGMVLPLARGLHARSSERARETSPPVSSRAALEQAILPALLRPPCVVSFSGGRDSSAVLAVATVLARREGLSLPIPATNTFGSEQDADESSWQKLLVDHLGLSDWIRLEHCDELDLIGPYAQRVLRVHGLLWPANVHFHVPLLELARNGSLLTGIGGDELFMAARRLRSGAVLSRAVRPRPRDILSLGLAYAPRMLRRAVLAHRARREVPIPWLRGPARRLVIDLLASEAAAEPRRLEERLPWWRQLRYLDVGTASLEVLARDTDTMIVHPLLATPFWAAVAREWGPHGFADRTEGMRRLFGDVLPAESVQRSSKTHLDKVFWTEQARTFARGWDGSGVPLEWVDAYELAQHWAGSNPTVASSFLLQAAWLASTN